MFFNFIYRVYARVNWFFYRVSTFKKNLWKLLFPDMTYIRFFWDDARQYEDVVLSEVPYGTIHVEQWRRHDDHIRRAVTYELQPIRFYPDDPFALVKTPWLWIGNPHDDDLDVTGEMEAYKVPGNCITPKLIEKVTGLNNAYYMCPRSLTILKFPEQGIVLERDDTV